MSTTETKKLQLEAGKMYVTRGGMKVTVKRVESARYDSFYQFESVEAGLHGNTLNYASDGTFLKNYKCPEDIIAEA